MGFYNQFLTACGVHSEPSRLKSCWFWTPFNQMLVKNKMLPLQIKRKMQEHSEVSGLQQDLDNHLLINLIFAIQHLDFIQHGVLFYFNSHNVSEVQLGRGNNKGGGGHEMGMSLKRMRGMDEARGRYNREAKGYHGANTVWVQALYLVKVPLKWEDICSTSGLFYLIYF